MISAEQRKKLRIYLVSPEGWGLEPEHETHLIGLLQAGVSTVQFREKEAHPHRVQRAQRMRELTRAHNALFIVNDDPNLARMVDADGVHVGVEDARVQDARQIVGNDRIVGATARTLARAQEALKQGADYLGVGAIYDATASKSDAKTIGVEGFASLRNHEALQDVPMVAIGGIRLENADACWAAGADGVAMIRGLWGLVPPFEVLRRAALRTTDAHELV